MALRNALISVIMLLLAAYGGAKFYMYYKAKEKIDEGLQFARLFADTDYGSISTSIFGSVGIRDLDIHIRALNESIHIGEILIDNYEEEANSRIPTRISVNIENFRVSADLFRYVNTLADESSATMPEIDKIYNKYFNNLDYFAEQGLDELKMDIAFEGVFDTKLSTLEIMLKGQMNKVSSDHLYLLLSDIFPHNIDSAVLGAKIKHLRYSLKDQGYYTWVLNNIARKLKVEPHVFRQSLIAQFDEVRASEDIKLSEKSAESIKRFINKPGRLVMDIKPHQPVAINSIEHYRLGDIPSLLNMRFYYEAP